MEQVSYKADALVILCDRKKQCQVVKRNNNHTNR